MTQLLITIGTAAVDLIFSAIKQALESNSDVDEEAVLNAMQTRLQKRKAELKAIRDGVLDILDGTKPLPE